MVKLCLLVLAGVFIVGALFGDDDAYEEDQTCQAVTGSSWYHEDDGTCVNDLDGGYVPLE